MRIEGPIRLKTAHSQHLLQVFHSDKDPNDPDLVREFDEEIARQYIYSEIIWRVIEDLYPKLKPFFQHLEEEHLKSHINTLFAQDKVKEKIQERYGVDFLTYIDISEEEAQKVVGEIISSCNLSELEETIGGELQDRTVMSKWIHSNMKDFI